MVSQMKHQHSKIGQTDSVSTASDDVTTKVAHPRARKLGSAKNLLADLKRNRIRHSRNINKSLQSLDTVSIEVRADHEELCSNTVEEERTVPETETETNSTPSDDSMTTSERSAFASTRCHSGLSARSAALVGKVKKRHQEVVEVEDPSVAAAASVQVNTMPETETAQPSVSQCDDSLVPSMRSAFASTRSHSGLSARSAALVGKVKKRHQEIQEMCAPPSEKPPSTLLLKNPIKTVPKPIKTVPKPKAFLSKPAPLPLGQRRNAALAATKTRSPSPTPQKKQQRKKAQPKRRYTLSSGGSIISEEEESVVLNSFTSASWQQQQGRLQEKLSKLLPIRVNPKKDPVTSSKYLIAMKPKQQEKPIAAKPEFRSSYLTSIQGASVSEESDSSEYSAFSDETASRASIPKIIQSKTPRSYEETRRDYEVEDHDHVLDNPEPNLSPAQSLDTDAYLSYQTQDSLHEVLQCSTVSDTKTNEKPPMPPPPPPPPVDSPVDSSSVMSEGDVFKDAPRRSREEASRNEDIQILQTEATLSFALSSDSRSTLQIVDQPTDEITDLPTVKSSRSSRSSDIHGKISQGSQFSDPTVKSYFIERTRSTQEPINQSQSTASSNYQPHAPHSKNWAAQDAQDEGKKSKENSDYFSFNAHSIYNEEESLMAPPSESMAKSVTPTISHRKGNHVPPVQMEPENIDPRDHMSENINPNNSLDRSSNSFHGPGGYASPQKSRSSDPSSHSQRPSTAQSQLRHKGPLDEQQPSLDRSGKSINGFGDNTTAQRSRSIEPPAQQLNHPTSPAKKYHRKNTFDDDIPDDPSTSRDLVLSTHNSDYPSSVPTIAPDQQSFNEEYDDIFESKIGSGPLYLENNQEQFEDQLGKFVDKEIGGRVHTDPTTTTCSDDTDLEAINHNLMLQLRQMSHQLEASDSHMERLESELRQLQQNQIH